MKMLVFPGLVGVGLVSGCDIDLPGVGGDGARFDRVENRIDADLELVHDFMWDNENRPWQVDCTDTDPEQIQAEVVSDTLEISAAELVSGEDCVVMVAAERIEEVVLAGNGDLRSDQPLERLNRLEAWGDGAVDLAGVQSRELTIDTRGNGQVYVTSVDVPNLFLVLAGNGNVTLSGAGRRAEVSVADSANLMARDLMLAELYVEVMNNGAASVMVTDTLDGLVDDQGRIEVWGNPEGTVEQRGDGQVVYHDEPPAQE